MKLFGLFGKQPKELPQVQNTDDAEGPELYAGMRVEVTTFEGELLFVAKLLGLRGSRGELHLYSEASVPPEGEPFRVQIRGYSDRDQKAVYMEGTVTPAGRKVWPVEELTVCKVGNDRAFFRLTTSLDASATMFSGLEMGEKPCKLLNISVGGASIASESRYHYGDKFLLKVRLLEDKPTSAMYAQVVRITEKEGGKYEYGCRFLELTEDDQEKITQNIYAVQRLKRRRM